jgi:hypothetical protein
MAAMPESAFIVWKVWMSLSVIGTPPTSAYA